MSVSQFLIPVLILLLPVPPPSYREQIEQWRREREVHLKSEDGWLALVGRVWLKEGRNTVGGDPASDIVLPPGTAPTSVGTFYLQNGGVRFESAPGVGATINGRPAVRELMQSDAAGSPDLLRVRDLTMLVIQRGSRFGIRIKDKNSPARKSFAGLNYFPIRESYRLKAKFVPYSPPRKIAVPNILGETTEELCPGYAEFTLGGKAYRLEPIEAGDELFFIFKDLTSSKETYAAGRFLDAERPRNGEVILDFNQAVNPPCAFTPYATCPLPPRQNRLTVRIEAGEMRYGHASPHAKTERK